MLAAATACVPFIASGIAGAGERKPLAKPGDTYVAISFHGCLGTCPDFELYVFDDGHLVFRGNNRYTARRGIVHRTVGRNTYQRLLNYLDSHPVFDKRPECVEWATDHPGVTAFSTSHGQPQKAYWYFGCVRDADFARELFETFVVETNTAALIDSDTREWEKTSTEMKKRVSK